MVKDPHKLKRETTLACDLLAQIKAHIIYSILLENYPTQTEDLLIQLQELDGTQNANAIEHLLPVIKNHSTNCNSYNDLNENHQKSVQLFFGTISKDLLNLNKNIDLYQVAISCALDGYTLNRTTYLISKLQTFIEDQQVKKYGKLFSLGASETSASSENDHQLREELAIAENLKNICEEIRKQIGSPETMPKGLLIELMVNLCEAIRSCQEAFQKPSQHSQDLFDCIHQEIKEIEKRYPDLAEVAEELQKAVANYQFQKP